MHRPSRSASAASEPKRSRGSSYSRATRTDVPVGVGRPAGAGGGVGGTEEYRTFLSLGLGRRGAGITVRFMPRPRTAAVAGAVMSVGIVYFVLLKSTTRSQEGDFFDSPWF